MADLVARSGERLAWGSLDRQQIVAAALEIARSEGIDALSVRRLAADLGASRMSLYRHVADKDALLDLVANAVAEGELMVPRAVGPWDEQLRGIAHSMRDQLLQFPGLVELLIRRPNSGPGGLRFADSMIALLSSAGFGEADGARFYLVFVDTVLGRVYRELHGDVASPARTERMVQAMDEPDRYPALVRAHRHLVDITPEAIFETEVEAVLLVMRAALDAG